MANKKRTLFCRVLFFADISISRYLTNIFYLILCCRNKACHYGERHKRAADKHTGDLDRFAVLDVLNRFVEFLEIEVRFKPILAADLQDAAECERARSEQKPETGIGSQSESAHSEQRPDEYAEDRRKQEADVHKRNGRGELTGNEKPVPDGVGDHRRDGDTDTDRCRAGNRAEDRIHLTCEIRRSECYFFAEMRETVNKVNGRVCGCGLSPGGAEEQCRRAYCDKQAGNAVEDLLILEEVGHCRFENVDDVEHQNDRDENLTG